MKRQKYNIKLVKHIIKIKDQIITRMLKSQKIEKIVNVMCGDPRQFANNISIKIEIKTL